MFPNLFLVCGTLTKFSSYLAAPVDGKMGIKIKEFYKLGAPLAPAHGTLSATASRLGIIALVQRWATLLASWATLDTLLVSTGQYMHSKAKN